MRNKLTALQVKNAGLGKHADGGGLYLVIRHDARAWVYRFSLFGKRREMGLGNLGLGEARKARDAAEALVKQGVDPVADRAATAVNARIEAQKIDPTFEEMALTVFEEHKETLRGGGQRGRWMSPLTLYIFPKIGRVPMSRITSDQIKAALAPIWRTKHPTAIKAVQRTKLVFTKARLRGADCDPFTVEMAREALGVVNRQTAHIVSTPWQDIPDLFAKLDAGTPTCAAIRFAMLTLVRSAGVRGAMFSEIEGDVWTVPALRMKGKEGKAKDFRVPLSTAALEAATTCADWSSTYCFPGVTKGCVSDQALTKQLDRLGEAGRVHGFRTSFRSWVQDTDACSWEVAETILAHTIGNKVERSYARSDILDRRRVAMQKWADFVTGQTGKVVQLHRPVTTAPAGLG